MQRQLPRRNGGFEESLNAPFRGGCPQITADITDSEASVAKCVFFTTFHERFSQWARVCICVCVKSTRCPTFWVLRWRCGSDRSDRLRWAAGTQRAGGDRKAWGIWLWQVGRAGTELHYKLLQRAALNIKLAPLIDPEKKVVTLVFLLIRLGRNKKKCNHVDGVLGLCNADISLCPPSVFIPLLISSAAYCSERPEWAAEKAEWCSETVAVQRDCLHREKGLILTWRQSGSWNSSPPDYSSIIHQHKKSLN